jgi:hypothetical protein
MPAPLLFRISLIEQSLAEAYPTDLLPTTRQLGYPVIKMPAAPYAGTIGRKHPFMSHPLQCRCRTLKGFVANPFAANRAICYCKDCQAFAHFLGRSADVLDARGGSDIVQILPKHITFTQGVESLACMRLTPKGMLRWYAGCCNTPIGNSLATPKFSFIGLVHSCLRSGGGTALDEAFGTVRAWVNTNGAKGDPKPKVRGQAATFGWFLATTVKARLNGDYRQTPFFRPDTGEPVVSPRVLSGEEHSRVMDAVVTN